MTITDAKYFREHSDVVQVAAYALHDVLHALKNDNCECLVSKEDGHLVVHYCKKRTESTDDKYSVCTDGNLDAEPMIDLHDWNRQDRQKPKKEHNSWREQMIMPTDMSEDARTKNELFKKEESNV